MNAILRLMKGDMIREQHELSETCKKIAECVEKGVGFVSMNESKKKILFPVMSGLGIPFADCDVNGVCVGDSIDVVNDRVSKI